MVNDLIESRAALNSNLFGMKKGRKGFMGESRLHGYPSLRFNADQAVYQSVIRPDHHGYYHQASDLAVTKTKIPLHTGIVLGSVISGINFRLCFRTCTLCYCV